MTHHPVPLGPISRRRARRLTAAVDSKVRSDLVQRDPVAESRLVTPAASCGVVTMAPSAGRPTRRSTRGISLNPASPLDACCPMNSSPRRWICPRRFSHTVAARPAGYELAVGGAPSVRPITPKPCPCLRWVAPGRIPSERVFGGVGERPKPLVWRTSVLLVGTAGSNPAPSASLC